MKKLMLATCLFSCLGANAAPSDDFESLAKSCAPGVHIKTLSSIVRHESRGNPYAIGVNANGARLPRQPKTKDEAVATAIWLKQNGYNFDSGLGQINSKNMDWLGLSVSDLFDSCKNLASAAKVITSCYRGAKAHITGEQEALHAALSCYNTGSYKRGISNGYVMAVAANVTLDVPALAPLTTAPAPSDPAMPVQLKAMAAQAQPLQSEPIAEGIEDAFSQMNEGAFAPASIEKIPPSPKGPVILKAE